jgi:hypothetical protein
MSIVNFINPLMVALGNVMAPKFVLALRDKGGSGLRHEAIRNTVLMSTAMVPFCLAISFAGGDLLHWLYPGKEYAGSGPILTVLAFSLFAGALGAAPSLGLATMERPRAIVVVGTIAAALSVTLVGLSMTKWGLLGAVVGLFLGNLIGAIGRWIAFFGHIPPRRDGSLVVPVLRQFPAGADYTADEITWIGGGERGDVFKIEPKEPRLPVCEHQSLVVKLYKSETKREAVAVHAQFNSLGDLHAILDGLQINGWKISIPRPLYVCGSPLALVMTAVPGRSIDVYMQKSDVLTPEVTRSAARAFAGAMKHYWSSGRMHGELGLCNVLFDVEAKTLSFIDALPEENCRTYESMANFSSAAAFDLAFALRDVVRGLLIDLTGSLPLRLNREMFVQAVLGAVLEDIPLVAEKMALLREIGKRFEENIEEDLELSWSPKGISHWIVKKSAVSRGRTILNRLIAENVDYPSHRRSFCHRENKNA